MTDPLAILVAAFDRSCCVNTTRHAREKESVKGAQNDKKRFQIIKVDAKNLDQTTLIKPGNKKTASGHSLSIHSG